MKRKLLKLEKLARRLEPSPAERKHVRGKVFKYTEGFLNKIESAKAFQVDSDKGIRLLSSPLSEKPIGIGKVLKLIAKNVDYPSLNPASGGHLGFIPGGGIYFSALGDYLADITNRYAAVFFAAPGAVRMENMLIRWVARLLGFPANAGGNLTSGGSLANLIGICTARDAQKINSTNIRKSVVYMSSQAHHSLDKAILIAGLGECIVRRVAIDDQYRIDAVKFAKQVAEDRKKKLHPFLVVASAGSTDVGVIDPLNEIAAIAKKYKLWFHVDAAYGGFFALTREGKKKLSGIQKADSVVADPHKGLFLPYGLGIVLVKNRKFLNASHYFPAHYMQDALRAADEPSPANLSPELSKPFRGIRMWLPLKLHGIKPFRYCLEEKLLLAKYFCREVKKIGFEVPHEPDLSVVAFRFIPKKGNANVFNEKLKEIIQQDGRLFVSSTLLNGNFMMRFACLHFRTHLNHVDMLLDILKKSTKNR